jgi:hypothetical protein
LAGSWMAHGKHLNVFILVVLKRSTMQTLNIRRKRGRGWSWLFGGVVTALFVPKALLVVMTICQEPTFFYRFRHGGKMLDYAGIDRAGVVDALDLVS